LVIYVNFTEKSIAFCFLLSSANQKRGKTFCPTLNVTESAIYEQKWTNRQISLALLHYQHIDKKIKTYIW
jgi:hypothetical protein